MTTRLRRFARRITPRPVDPLQPADPRAVFILGLAAGSGIPLLFGDTGGPHSLESLLPTWVVIIWGLFLCVGSAVTLYGIPRRADRDLLKSVIYEQIGSIAVGGASLVYSVALLGFFGSTAVYIVPYTAGFGLACLWRFTQLQLWLLDQPSIIRRSGETDE